MAISIINVASVGTLQLQVLMMISHEDVHLLTVIHRTSPIRSRTRGSTIFWQGTSVYSNYGTDMVCLVSKSIPSTPVIGRLPIAPASLGYRKFEYRNKWKDYYHTFPIRAGQVKVKPKIGRG